MNKHLKQKNAETESWQETPYVSRFTEETIKELERPDLKARVSMKAFAIVCIGLLISTIAAHLASPYYIKLYTVLTALLFLQFIFMFITGWVIGRNNLLLAGIVYFLYSVNTGIVFSVLFLKFESDAIKDAFLIAAIAFGAMAAIGYFTKKDLSTVGGIYGTVLLGGLLVTLFNFLVFHRSKFELFLVYVIVILFAGIIGYNMTGLRKKISEAGEENEERIALLMGMQLYINFMNVFVWLVQIIDKFTNTSKKR